MTRHPSENFIKYLITSGHPNANDDTWIRTMLMDLGFPAPESDYLSWLRASLASKVPADFRPTDRYHRESRAFLKSEGIFGIHTQSKAVREANTIVMDNRARPLVEDLLLGRLEPKEVAKKVNSKLAIFLTDEGVEAYRHYYWQVSIIRVEDWARLLANQDLQKNNVLAITQVGAALALHKTGFQQHIDSKSMLRTMQESIFFDFQEWKTKKHSTERTKALTNLAKSAVMVDEQLSQSDSALKDSLKAFEQFRMETAKTGVPDIRNLAPGGNYSGSGAKLIEAKSKEPDDEEGTS